MWRSSSEIVENDELFSILKAEHYDIALAESWQECPFGLFHALGIPIRLGTFAVPMATQLAGTLGIPSPPSFVPCMYKRCSLQSFAGPLVLVMLTPTISGDDMSYWERTRNVGFRLLDWYFGRQLTDQIDRMYRKKHGADFPCVQKIVANVSLAFVNANPFFDLPRPISHKTIYIGGIVEKKPKLLSSVS